MSRRPVGQLLRDILERIQRIERYVVGFERDAFLSDSKTSDSVRAWMG